MKIAARNVHERLHREPFYIHPRLRVVPNIVINVITFLVALALISAFLYIIVDYLIKAFYSW